MARGDKQISFRVATDEYAKIKEMANRAGISIPSLAKKATLNQEVKEQIIDRETGRQIIAALGKIGSNINQIAKKVNAGENTDTMLEVMKVSDEINDFWKLLIDGKYPKRKVKKSQEISSTPVADQRQAGRQQEQEKRYCEVCGAELIIKQSKTDKQNYWVCPNWKMSDKNHTVILAKEGEKDGVCKGNGVSQSNSRPAVR